MESGQPTASAARSPETRGWLLNLEIHRGCFPVVLFDLILEVLPFIERAQSSALDRGDVDEYIFAACLRLDKSVALRRIEPLHGAARQFDLPSDDPGDVIPIGKLVAKAMAELYTAVFRCLARAAAACRCRGASGINLTSFSGLLTFVEIARARIRSAGKGHINGRVRP